VDRTVDGDVLPDTHTMRDGDATRRDLTVNHQHMAGARSPAREPLPPGAASRQVIVGDIPGEPPGFRPRAGLLAELDRTGTQVSVLHPVTGLQGLGVTQLAAAYARAKMAAGWRLVAWVNAADTGSLLAGLAAVADATGLADSDSERGIADAGAAVRRGLEADGDRCLLVFDDVPDPEILRAFVPVRGTARVLITSTRRQAADLGSNVPVDAFSAQEASAFLARRTGLHDEAGAAEVGAVLGHLPLALSLAAPLIAGRRPGYGWYLDRLQATSADVSLTRDDGQPYPPGVAEAVLLSLQAVRTADRTGLCTRVMEIMAVLSSAGVRRELLYAAGQAGVLASSDRRVAAGLVDRVLEWLSDRSLLTLSVDGQTVILHRLVARVIREGLARRQMLTAVYEAAAFVLDLYSRALVGSQDRPAVRGILRQVTALLDSLAGPAPEVDQELGWLLLRLRFTAFYHALELRDSPAQAIAVGEPLTADLERRLGPDHPDTLNSRNSLAAAYLAAGRVAEAIPLFEQILDVRQRMLGPGHPDTLTSQNNLASAYQDAGRPAEAIRLYELNLEVRERLLGPDHLRTLTSRGNLAAAYRDAGRAAEAIPLLEQTLAGRERVLGPDHADTRTSRKNLASAYQDAGRAAEASPLLEQTLAGREPVLRSDNPDTQTSPENLADPSLTADRAAGATPPTGQAVAAQKSHLPDGAAGHVLPGVRRPPADPARRVLPVGFRRPPAHPAGQALLSSVARPQAELTEHSTRRAQDPSQDVQYDLEVVAAITAGDPAGIAMAYDRYAAALYGYCHWMLHDPADAAKALRDTFVVAATLSGLSEPSRLRPWLFALARNQCRRRIRPAPASRNEEADAAPHQVDPAGQSTYATHQPADATIPFRVVGLPADAIREPADATVQFRVVGLPADAIDQPADATREAADATVQFPVVGLPADATMPFRVVSLPASAPDGLTHLNGDREQAELRTLIYSILAGLKPREREVIELTFRHHLYDNDLAIALGVSESRAHTLASRARSQLEKALSALHIALTRREACPVLGELLADWDGQLTEETSDLIGWHLEECQTCAHHGWGALRPEAFSRLLPLAPLPPELREQVLSLCTSTAGNAVAYRRRLARHAGSTWFARFSQAISVVKWDSIRANPGAAIATAAVAVWVVAALSITLLTFAGSHAAHAQEAQPSVPASLSPPAAAAATATTPASVPTSAPPRTARPSPTFSQPPAYVPVIQPSPSPSPKPSASPKPSKSPSPSHTPSPSPSSSPSPSPTI